ncbi:MAG: hypothetical protein P4N24_20960 [Acidobacteriota bacterium]|nr:hypothetical protein [Acidobacteriota bacterium]
MNKIQRLVIILLAITALISSISATAKRPTKATTATQEIASSVNPVLWQSPGDIRTRNLFFGPGGEKHAPHTVFTFVKEDMNGTNPKFDIHDENGIKWKVKSGAEVRPETVASRLVWAVGYSANEDYFLPELHVEGLPAHLRRGQNLVGPGGTFHNVRLKRDLKDEKKIGDWKWRSNPFSNTRELNGLRVMMALINNWDVKDENNAVYEEKHADGPQGPEHIFMISDLGASFGTTGRSWTHAGSKGNLNAYSHSRFISKVTEQYVDFNFPTRPAVIFLFTPREFFSRVGLRWIGKDIPIKDAQWMGQLLSQLSPEQVRDAFRAAGYPSEEVEGFSKVVEGRIAQLNKLLEWRRGHQE